MSAVKHEEANNGKESMTETVTTTAKNVRSQMALEGSKKTSI